MDQRRRELERLAHAGDPEALARFLREQARVGAIDPEDLRLAAHLGYEPAELATGLKIPASPRSAWLGEIQRRGRDAVVLALLAAAEASLDVWRAWASVLRLELVPRHGEPRVERIDRRVVVGRIPGEADLALFDPGISRRHFSLEPNEEPYGLRVTDLDSRSGTWLNGLKLPPDAVAVPGDELQAGGTTFRLLLPDERPAAAVEAARAWQRDPSPANTELLDYSLRQLLGAVNAAAQHHPLTVQLAGITAMAAVRACRVEAPSTRLASAAPLDDAALRRALRTELLPLLLEEERTALPDPSDRWQRADGFELLAPLTAAGRQVAAWDTTSQRLVARWETAYTTIPPTEELSRLFDALRRIEHLGLARVVHAGMRDLTASGILSPVVATELVPGRTLSEWDQDEGGRSHAERAGVIRAVCAPLDHCGREGLPHGALGPNSVVVRLDGQPVVLDLGRRQLESLEHDGELDFPQAEWLRYASPEVIRGQPGLTTSGDVYSLGALLFRLTTGRPPFEGPIDEVVLQINDAHPPAPRDLDPTITPYLEGVILRCLEKDPERRYATPAELAQALADERVG